MPQQRDQGNQSCIVIAEERSLPMLNLVDFALDEGVNLIHSELDITEALSREKGVVERKGLISHCKCQLNQTIEDLSELLNGLAKVSVTYQRIPNFPSSLNRNLVLPHELGELG